MKKKFNYANAVQEILDKIEVSYMSQKKDAGTIFNIPMPGQNMSNLTVNLHVHNNGNVKIAVYPVRKVKQQFRTDILEVLNGLNGKYRITRFMIDADGDICVDYDMILTDEDSNIIGSQILMTLLMFSDIVDETFLEILLTSRYGKKINQKVTALLSNVEQAVSDKDDPDEDDFDGDDPDEDDFDGDDPDEDDFDEDDPDEDDFDGDDPDEDDFDGDDPDEDDFDGDDPDEDDFDGDDPDEDDFDGDDPDEDDFDEDDPDEDDFDGDDPDEDDFDEDDPDEDDFDEDDPDEDDFDGDETLESLLPEMDAEFLQKLISISEKCFDEDDE